MNRYQWMFLLALPLMIVLIGCGEEQAHEENGELTIVATTGMIADAAQNIVGEKASVVGLMGPGVDPHLYKATQRDLELLTSADIVLYNGLHLEGKMGEVLEKLAERKPVIAVAGVVDTAKLLQPEEYEGAFDPHVWFDVEIWRNIVARLGDTLASLDPENAGTYRSNRDSFVEQLDSLHANTKKMISTIPEKARILVTAHDAFGYFGKAYGIEVRGLQGISTVSEFGLADRNALVNLIVDRKVKSVFIESSVPKRNVEALVESVNSRDHQISIGGELFSDAMGADGTPEGTYIGMVRHNVNAIVEGLR